MRHLLAFFFVILLSGLASAAAAAETHAHGADPGAAMADWAHAGEAADLCCDATVTGHCGETPASAPDASGFAWPAARTSAPPERGRIPGGAAPPPDLRPPIV